MRIAQVAPINHKIATQSEYGVYSNVALICDGAVDFGHKTTLFSAKDAETKAKIDGIIEANSRSLGMTDQEALPLNHMNLSRCFQQAEKFDIIHSHYSTFGTYYAPIVDQPTVHSVHNPLSDNFLKIKEFVKNQKYISFSLAQRTQYPDLNWIANIYHGIDESLYQFSPTHKGYLLYLGRLIEEKGVHHAIQAAKAAGKKLVISGMSRFDSSYWQKEVEPHIDAKQVKYVGPSDLERKIALMQGAEALLFPTQAEETFGLVMIEAMACGTPVIGFDRGAVREVVKDGVTGYVVQDAKEMEQAIHAIDKLDRIEARKRAEIYFTAKKMVSGYLKVYARVLDEWNFKNKKFLLSNPWKKRR